MTEYHVTTEVKAAYIELHGAWAWDEDHASDSFDSCWEHLSDLEDYIVESFLECIDIPEALQYYIDNDAILRDLLIDSYIYQEYEGQYYLFRRI